MKRTLLTVLTFLFAATAAYAAPVTGKVTFEGQKPAAQKLKADADPQCKAHHPGGVEDDSVLVNADGTLKNVFVYVKTGLEGKTFETPKDFAKLDQQGCMYVPKVLGAQTNQSIEIINSDATLHNVHALPKNSKEFNLGMPVKGMKLKRAFTKAEVMIKVKCEVHPWMSSYVGVVDHPHFGVTGDDGKFDLKDLPAGSYEIEAWHEKFGTQTQKITVTDQPQDLAFSFKAA